VAWGNASVNINDDSRVDGNSASLGGGGVSVQDAAHVTVTGGRSVSNNRALSVDNYGGGGLSAWDNASITITDGSRVEGNSAGTGGGVAVQHSVCVTIAGGSRVSNNVAFSDVGGGLSARENARVTITDGSSVYGNKANVSGCGVFVGENSVVTITDSSVHSNTAITGGGMYTHNTSQVVVTNSSVHANTAHLCGGLVVGGETAMNITRGSSVHSNTADIAGGLCATGDAPSTWRDVTGGVVSTIMHNSSVHSNRAMNGSGGGLLVSAGTVLTISTGSIAANNTCVNGVGGGLAAGIDFDNVRFGGMGRLEHYISAISGDGMSQVTISNSSFLKNTSEQGAGGGVVVASRSIVTVTKGAIVSGNRVVNGLGGAVFQANSAGFQADGSVVFDNNRVPPGYVGSTIVAFGESNLSLPARGELTKCSGGVYLGRTPCGVGENLQHDVCVCCPPHTFSFTNSSCNPCPANAVCLGASVYSRCLASGRLPRRLSKCIAAHCSRPRVTISMSLKSAGRDTRGPCVVTVSCRSMAC
jgi:hypothetical protein